NGGLSTEGTTRGVNLRKWLQKFSNLTEGNIVKDYPVPEEITKNFDSNDLNEFTHMRYTACTSKPDDFMSNSFTLRQAEFRRETELFIAVTMYNEDENQLNQTFNGIVENINSLCSQENNIWGWKKVVVCIISDGRKKINKSSLNYLSKIGVYREGTAESIIDRKVEAHIFEYTARVRFKNVNNVPTPVFDNDNIPIQVLFCLKEKNARKINSHRWIFNAFSPVLDPKICILIDVGTKPGTNSIYNLWETFNSHPKVAGACGEIVVMKGRAWHKLIKPIVSAQYFEYKISNILDKPLEHVLGYITVLPGAFSAYRYASLKNTKDANNNDEGPLVSYFKGEKYQIDDIVPNTDNPSCFFRRTYSRIKCAYRCIKCIFAANMYLAEDRILCFELFTKRDQDWLLYYNKSSWAETDVPEGISEFVSQRRRWLNGSFFA
ncbi:4306_t:CDS:2, partial [Scutellospora calospora]